MFKCPQIMCAKILWTYVHVLKKSHLFKLARAYSVKSGIIFRCPVERRKVDKKANQKLHENWNNADFILETF